jgi:hypothetical protein
MRMRNFSFIWYVGAVAWWFDAAVAVHYGHKGHALLALAIACLFFVTGRIQIKTSEKHR